MKLEEGQIIYVSRNPLLMEPDSKLLKFTVKQVTEKHFYATCKGFPSKFDIITMKCLKRSRYDQAYLKESDYPRPNIINHQPDYTTNSLVELDLDELYKEDNNNANN